jgi:hypothetical protein
MAINDRAVTQLGTANLMIGGIAVMGWAAQGVGAS